MLQVTGRGWCFAPHAPSTPPGKAVGPRGEEGLWRLAPRARSPSIAVVSASKRLYAGLMPGTMRPQMACPRSMCWAAPATWSGTRYQMKLPSHLCHLNS